jgi:hypothetical protein
LHHSTPHLLFSLRYYASALLLTRSVSNVDWSASQSFLTC